MKTTATSPERIGRRRALRMATVGVATTGAATAALVTRPVAAGAASPTDWFDVSQGYGLPAPSGDATAAVQAALNAANAAGGGIVYLPARQYKISSALTIGANVVMTGAGPNSYLRAVGSNFDFVLKFGAASHVSTVRDLRISGSNVAGGIEMLTSGTGAFSGSDSYSVLENITIHDARTDGVVVGAGSSTREARLHNVVVLRSKTGHGIVFNGVDSVLSNCTAATCDLDGFLITGGNNRLTGCKAFFNSGSGITVTGNRTQLSACQAQDNDGDGIKIDGSDDTSLSACAADSNQFVGIRIRDCLAVTFDSASSFSRGGGLYTQAYGVRIQNSTDSRITGVSRGNTTNLNVVSSPTVVTSGLIT